MYCKELLDCTGLQPETGHWPVAIEEGGSSGVMVCVTVTDCLTEKITGDAFYR